MENTTPIYFRHCARSTARPLPGNKVGLHMHKENYQSILPKLTFRNGKLDDCQEVPLYLTLTAKTK